MIKPKYGLILLVLTGLFMPRFCLLAHHATAIDFDTSRTIKLKGVVSKLNWSNPHTHVWIDVKGEHGETEHWDVELGSPGAVIVSGLSREVLSPGTTIAIVGYPAKANTSSDLRRDPAVCATQLTLADGTTAQFVVGI